MSWSRAERFERMRHAFTVLADGWMAQSKKSGFLHLQRSAEEVRAVLAHPELSYDAPEADLGFLSRVDVDRIAELILPASLSERSRSVLYAAVLRATRMVGDDQLPGDVSLQDAIRDTFRTAMVEGHVETEDDLCPMCKMKRAQDREPTELNEREVDLLEHLLVATQAERAANPTSGRAAERDLSLATLEGVLKRAVGKKPRYTVDAILDGAGDEP
jgi:hypothetical protein